MGKSIKNGRTIMVDPVKVMENELATAFKAGQMSKVAELAAKIDRVKNAPANPYGALSEPERFVMNALDSWLASEESKTNKWKGLNVVLQILPGKNFTVNQVLHHKFGLSREQCKEVTASLVARGLIGVIPARKSARIYKVTDMPARTMGTVDTSDWDFTGLL